jgi:hypothetical protein
MAGQYRNLLGTRRDLLARASHTPGPVLKGPITAYWGVHRVEESFLCQEGALCICPGFWSPVAQNIIARSKQPAK